MGKGSDNLKYREMEVEEGVYLPDIDIEYPEDDPFRKIAPVFYNGRQVVLDETFPYNDESFHSRFHHFLNRTMLRFMVRWLNRVRYGLKIVGKENLRKNKKFFKNGAMTVCNHVYRWDMACVLDATGYKTTWFPIYGDHMRGSDMWFMRYLGGVPLPETRSGMRPFAEAFDEYHRRGNWLHFFPESCSWKFYAPIRPFKKGAFTMAYRYNLPVIPMVLSYRPRTGIYKWFDKPEIPLVTLHVGEPVFPDQSKNIKEESHRLLLEAHSRMVAMAGITKNPWPACEE